MQQQKNSPNYTECIPHDEIPVQIIAKQNKTHSINTENCTEFSNLQIIEMEFHLLCAIVSTANESQFQIAPLARQSFNRQ